MKYGPFGLGDFVIVAVLNISRSLIQYNVCNSSVKDIRYRFAIGEMEKRRIFGEGTGILATEN